MYLWKKCDEIGWKYGGWKNRQLKDYCVPFSDSVPWNEGLPLKIWNLNTHRCLNADSVSSSDSFPSVVPKSASISLDSIMSSMIPECGLWSPSCLSLRDTCAAEYFLFESNALAIRWLHLFCVLNLQVINTYGQVTLQILHNWYKIVYKKPTVQTDLLSLSLAPCWRLLLSSQSG